MAQAADVSQRTRVTFNNIQYFLKRFPCLMPTECSMDQLEIEFASYQIASCEIEELESKKIDQIWMGFGDIKDEAGVLLYRNLSKVITHNST